MGPAVDEKQWKTDFDYINIGQEEGAKLVLGGKKPEHLGKGHFVEPTIFDNVTPSMRIFKEEIFGPVLSIATAKNLEEALAYANGVEYGLTASILPKTSTRSCNSSTTSKPAWSMSMNPPSAAKRSCPLAGRNRPGSGNGKWLRRD
jgi:acyl-CoA reductase-like NAD-dependent aldehyde dehydrogenase